MHLVQKRQTAKHHTDHLCQGVKLGVTAVKKKSLAVIYPSLQLHIPVPGNSKASDSLFKILLFLSFLCNFLFSLFCFFFLSLLFSFFRGKWVNQASEVKMEKLVPRFADFKPFRQISLKQLKEVLYIISRLTVINVKNMKRIYIPATERTSRVSYQLCKR